jgi:hypothetical protein
MKMKRFIKWLRRHTPQQSVTGDTDQRARVKPEQKTEDEYNDNSSFHWEAADRNESSDSNKDTPKPDPSDNEDAAPLATLELEDGPLSIAEEDIGVDPYNTGSFDTEKK